MALAARRVFGVIVMVVGALVILAGVFAALATWAVMSTYPDETSNTLAQTLSPLLLVLPAAGMGGVLVHLGRTLWRGPDLDQP